MRQVWLSLLCRIVFFSVSVLVNKTTKIKVSVSSTIYISSINRYILPGTCCDMTRHVKQALITSAITYATVSAKYFNQTT